MREILEAFGWTERIILRLMLYLIAAGSLLSSVMPNSTETSRSVSGITFVIAIGMLATSSSGNRPAR